MVSENPRVKQLKLILKAIEIPFNNHSVIYNGRLWQPKEFYNLKILVLEELRILDITVNI